jgi:hypothetical protein
VLQYEKAGRLPHQAVAGGSVSGSSVMGTGASGCDDGHGATSTAPAGRVCFCSLAGSAPYSSLRQAGTSPSASRSLVGYWLLISHVVLCGISIAV